HLSRHGIGRSPPAGLDGCLRTQLARTPDAFSPGGGVSVNVNNESQPLTPSTILNVLSPPQEAGERSPVCLPSLGVKKWVTKCQSPNGGEPRPPRRFGLVAEPLDWPLSEAAAGCR